MKNLLILNAGFLTNGIITLIIVGIVGIVAFVIWGENASKPLKKKYEQKIEEEEKIKKEYDEKRFRRLFKKFKARDAENFNLN